MIDQTITIGNIVEILTIIGGGFAAFVSMRGTVAIVMADLLDVKADIKALNQVMIAMAVADQRLSAVELDIREMKHGKGFIRESIEREYPSASAR